MKLYYPQNTFLKKEKKIQTTKFDRVENDPSVTIEGLGPFFNTKTT